MLTMEDSMVNSHDDLLVNCDFTWIVGHSDRTTPADNSPGFKVSVNLH